MIISNDHANKTRDSIYMLMGFPNLFNTKYTRIKYMQNSPLSTPPHLAFACPQAKQIKEFFFNYKINLPTPN